MSLAKADNQPSSWVPLGWSPDTSIGLSPAKVHSVSCLSACSPPSLISVSMHLDLTRVHPFDALFHFVSFRFVPFRFVPFRVLSLAYPIRYYVDTKFYRNL